MRKNTHFLLAFSFAFFMISVLIVFGDVFTKPAVAESGVCTQCCVVCYRLDDGQWDCGTSGFIGGETCIVNHSNDTCNQYRDCYWTGGDNSRSEY